MALINNRNPTEHHNDPHSNCSHQRKSFTEDYTKHFFTTRRILKIGIEKIQETNNHFHRNESYTSTASAKFDDTSHIFEQNFILVDESVTHPEEHCPTSCQIFQDRFLSNNKCITRAPQSANARMIPMSDSQVAPYFRTENTPGQIF